jgi:hypothetical protein
MDNQRDEQYVGLMRSSILPRYRPGTIAKEKNPRAE